jgi:pseudouridine-5'-phosphate glycosidase
VNYGQKNNLDNFWSRLSNIRVILSLETSKGVLKRFAHWEWDQNTNKERFKDLAEK